MKLHSFYILILSNWSRCSFWYVFFSFLAFLNLRTLAFVVFIYYNYYIPHEFYIPLLAGGLSLESEWQQVSSDLQDSSGWSSQFQECRTLDNLDSSSDFQFIQSFFQAFWTVQSALIIFHCFLVLWQGLSICWSFRFLLFLFCSRPGLQNPLDGKFFFFC